VANRFQGHSDVPLDDVGVRQARAAAQVLRHLPVSGIISSDLERAIMTARELSTLNGVAIAADPRLRETFASSWEGLTHDEIRGTDGERFSAWRVDHTIRPGGGGETRSEVAQRVVAAIEEFVQLQPDGGTLVAVTHGGAARAAVGLLTALPASTWGRFHVLDNCGWAVLSRAEGHRWQLRAYNRAVDGPQ
jgi:glucosyl-3-phosphoglycerate phosphatase